MAKSKKKEQKRFPRIYGLTIQMIQYNKLPEDQKPETLIRIQEFVIHQWFLSSGSLCGIYYDSLSLSRFVNCSIERIQEHLRNQLYNTKIWDKDKQDEILQSLLSQQLLYTMEDRQLVDFQISLLLKSQGDSYKPYISSEVNKAIKLRLESTTSAQTFLRGLTGSPGSVNIFNQFNQQNNLDQEAGLGYNEVLEIIQANNESLPIEEKRELYLENHYDLNSLPEIRASLQQDIDTTKEGLTNIDSKKELLIITDNYDKANEVADTEFEEIIEKAEHHSKRRQREIQEDEGSDDPENEVY